MDAGQNRLEKPGAIRSDLPDSPEIPVAFKPGEIAGVATEWAIVSLEARPYVLVVRRAWRWRTRRPRR